MNYRIIDSHCHPQFPQYDADRENVIRRALEWGVGMVCVGTDLETSRAAVDLALRYEGLWVSVGLHPNDELGVPFDVREYEKLGAHLKVIAIGEIGLDYFRTPEGEPRALQRKRFVEQLALARRTGKPAIIHCRDAHDDMAGILKNEGRDIPAVIHSFNGSVEQARSYLDEGFFIGLNAIVTFSRQYRDMVRSLPLDRILLETDAPYLAPEPYRGKRNEPSYIEAVGNRIAEMLGIEPARLFSITTENFKKLFSIIV